MWLVVRNKSISFNKLHTSQICSLNHHVNGRPGTKLGACNGLMLKADSLRPIRALFLALFTVLPTCLFPILRSCFFLCLVVLLHDLLNVYSRIRKLHLQ
jgi:hypothetical protein